MLQQLLRIILPVVSMESTVVDVQEAYKKADECVERLLVSIDPQIRAAAKTSLCDMIYASRESGAVSSEKLHSLLSESNIHALRRAIVKKGRARLLFQADCVFNPLPSRLGSLTADDLQHIYFLNVPEQTNGWTCGLWGEYNAHALHYLQSKGLPCSNDAITRFAKGLYAQRDSHIIEVNRLCGQDEGIVHNVLPRIDALVKLAQYLDTSQKVSLAQDLHFITYLKSDAPTFSEEDPSVLKALKVNAIEEVENLYHISDTVASGFREDFNKRGLVSFLCFIYEPDVHWIKCSIIKFDGYKPIMIILDSYNFPITEDGDAAKVISFVYEKMLGPLRDSSPEKD